MLRDLMIFAVSVPINTIIIYIYIQIHLYVLPRTIYSILLQDQKEMTVLTVCKVLSPIPPHEMSKIFP